VYVNYFLAIGAYDREDFTVIIMVRGLALP